MTYTREDILTAFPPPPEEKLKWEKAREKLAEARGILAILEGDQQFLAGLEADAKAKFG